MEICNGPKTLQLHKILKFMEIADTVLDITRIVSWIQVGIAK